VGKTFSCIVDYTRLSKGQNCVETPVSQYTDHRITIPNGSLGVIYSGSIGRSRSRLKMVRTLIPAHCRENGALRAPLVVWKKVVQGISIMATCVELLESVLGGY
jgi:hypothetical protein